MEIYPYCSKQQTYFKSKAKHLSRENVLVTPVGSTELTVSCLHITLPLGPSSSNDKFTQKGQWLIQSNLDAAYKTTVTSYWCSCRNVRYLKMLQLAWQLGVALSPLLKKTQKMLRHTNPKHCYNPHLTLWFIPSWYLREGVSKKKWKRDLLCSAKMLRKTNSAEHSFPGLCAVWKHIQRIP